MARLGERILVFTGAGISTGSGIPDFRGPQGVWKRRQPVYIQDFLAHEASRIEYWEYKLEGYREFREARPNAAHRALVELEKQGRLLALVTQNIDGLHVLAGNSPALVMELHGTNRLVSCLTCGLEMDPAGPFAAFEETGKPPMCACGGWLKPATISFGQALPEALLERAFAAAAACDAVWSLGSTLQVEPAASVPAAAARRGVPYLVINRGETAHDHLATDRRDGDLCEILPSLIC